MFQTAQPICVSAFFKDLYIVQGAENIKEMFKNSWASTSTFLHEFSLRYAFGMSEKADDSGGGPKPRPGSTVEARIRVDYRSYQTTTQLLSGSGFRPFWHRYRINITSRLRGHSISSEWQSLPDFMHLFESEVSGALMDALCGKHLLHRNPDFLRDLWQLDRHLDTLFKGISPNLCSENSFARENFEPSGTEPSGDDPFWGSRFFRDRQKIFLEMDGMDYDAIASEDFGAIWASTRNSVMAAFWMALEIFHDPAMLESVREEVRACTTDAPGKLFDTDRLLLSPLLQSIYAETLRLRVHIFMSAPRTESVWNTSREDNHPVDGFWAEHFLKFSGIGGSGPRKRIATMNAQTSTLSRASLGPIFAPEDVEGAWIPYGGGPRMCRGRHFAKREMILTAAIMVTLFDCEILADVRSLKMDMKGVGFGTLGVEGAVPVRIRRRKTNP
ncbi:cytochrome P450 [Aspergillus desertorum]